MEETLSNKLKSEQKPEGSEGESHVVMCVYV